MGIQSLYSSMGSSIGLAVPMGASGCVSGAEIMGRAVRGRSASPSIGMRMCLGLRVPACIRSACVCLCACLFLSLWLWRWLCLYCGAVRCSVVQRGYSELQCDAMYGGGCGCSVVQSSAANARTHALTLSLSLSLSWVQ